MPAHRNTGPIGAVLHELRSGTFFGNARARSSRRKSPWNFLLALALPLWLGLFLGGVRIAHTAALAILHGRAIPDSLIWPSVIAPFFAYFPLLLATMTTAMVLINYFVYYCVPPARRAMGEEDKAYPAVEYAVQQPVLVRISIFLLAIASPLAVLGEVFL